MKILWSCFFALLLVACQAQDGYSPKTTVDVEQPQEGAASDTQMATTPDAEKPEIVEQSVDVTFLDLSGFDDDLSESLRNKNREVVINLPAKFSLNDIPERMDVWLARVKDSGGKVQAQPIPKEGEMQTRGLISALIDLVISGYEMAAEEIMYSPAEKYNVLLKYDADTGEVKEAVFYHR